ncbi:MAG: DNA primase [Candidatus Paceibacterota bacterium]|jgi:DNA primase
MNRTAVEEIKARIPIEELIGTYVKLEKAGKSYKARCPFHNEKSASFFVSPERGGYYCFGCGAKGDIFSFVEQFEGLDFRGALKVLAEKAGVPLVVDKKTDSERDQLFEIMELSAKFFEDQYKKSEEAQKYMKSRGINPESREMFRIGWAPLGWKNLLTHLRSKGWNENMIEKAGLIKKKDNEENVSSDKGYSASNTDHSTFYDRFRGRIIFPITDSSGRVVAFTGRILVDDGRSAKYLNSPDTPLYNKSAILFGLDKAKTEIRRVGYSILVEGQMDLVLSHQVGVKNTIAASGTALTAQAKDETGIINNLGMVRRLSPNMIIALDSDKAGKTASMRAVAATALSMGMSVKIADIEGGKDPADLITIDPESWKNVLKNAKHVVEFELNNVMSEVTDPHKLSRAVRERVFPFLIKIDSEMDKALYVRLISERTSLSELAVWEDLKKYGIMNPENKSGVTGTTNSTASNIGGAQPNTNSNKDINKMGSVPQTKSRFNLVERRMIGLLFLMEAIQDPSLDRYTKTIKDISGDSYKDLRDRMEKDRNDIVFEAESFFGTETSKWPVHMDELILNFEEDLLNQSLIEAMGQLRQAERENNKGLVEEWAKKCQAMSVRKAELNKKRLK